MASLLAFVRSRTKSKSAQSRGLASATEKDGEQHTPTEARIPEDAMEASPRSPGYAAVDRRIVRDIAGLMNALPGSAEEPTGLKPPRRAARKPIVPAPEDPHATATVDQPDNVSSPSPPTSACNDGSRPALSKNASSARTGGSPASSITPESSPGETPRRRRVLSRFSRQMASVSTWATFGKSTDLDAPDFRNPAPPPSAWNNYFGSTESVALRHSSSSKRVSRSKNISATSLHHRNDPSRASSDLRLAGPSTPPTKYDDRYDTHDYDVHQQDPYLDNIPRLHSSHSSHRRSRSRPRSASRSQSTRSRPQSAYYSAPATPPDLVLATPYTFGAPSPPGDNTSRYDSPPPPLPPLQHPELLSALSSQSRLDVSNTLSNTYHLPAPTWTATLHASTYPRRRRRKTMSDVRAAASTPTLTVPKLRRPRSASLPRVHRIFRISSTDRLRRGSANSPRRRASTEWATTSVAALLPSDFVTLDCGNKTHPLGRESNASRGGEAWETGGTGRLQGQVSGNAEPRVTQAGEQRDPTLCTPPSRLIPTSPSPDPLQLPPAQEAAEGPGSHDSFRSMDTSRSIRLQRPSNDDIKLPRNGSATDTLTRSASTAARGDTAGAGPSRRASHRSNPSPVPSSLRLHEPSESSSSPSPPSRTKSVLRTPRSGSEPGLNPVPETPTNSKGKRKAEELDITPPDQKTGHHATFAIPPEARRSHRSSEVSKVPSSYHRKRARLSASTPQGSPARPASSQLQPSPEQNSSWSRRSAQIHLFRSGSRASHAQSAMSGRRAESVAGRRSIDASEHSIPISALITPHAPSVARSSTYHMRDPKRLPKIHPTEWTPHLRSEDEDASPLHAWCFFVGFVLFPIWWLASFWPIPKTRRVGGTDVEKAVTLDDPQVEHDARTWRNRCRIMSGISVFTYIPFIVLIAVFVPRHV